VSAGARYTDEEKDFDFGFNIFGLPEDPTSPPDDPDPKLAPMELSYDDVLTRFVVEYAATDNANVYLQRSEGFKGGGFSAIALFSTAPIGAYEPETNETYELGLKADWFDSTLRTNLAYYMSDIEDIQQNSTENVTGGLEFPVENVGDAEIDGLEFEIYWSPLDQLNLFLVGSWMDGEYGDLVDGAAASRAEEAFGVEAQTPQTPDYSYTVGFDYSFEFSNAAFSGASFGMDYYVVDDYVSAATNDALNPGFERINAFINVDIDDNWQASLTAKNLTDEFTVVSGSRGLGGFVTLPPKEYLFTVYYKY
jgi:iron complex outermembrane receptor protein